jgi:nicotinic acid mononucleotide adenylyltransferase
LKEACIEQKAGTILYSGSFDPPGYHNIAIAKALSDFASDNDIVWVIPYGGRPGKNGISRWQDRREMILRALCGSRKALLDFMDLRHKEMTPNVDMDRRFRNGQPNREVWHVIGANMIIGGAKKQSKIHLKWKEGPWVFDHLNFIVLVSPDSPIDEVDLPPHHKILTVNVQATSQEIRNRVLRGEPIDHLVPPNVLSYIQEQKLYLPNPAET